MFNISISSFLKKTLKKTSAERRGDVGDDLLDHGRDQGLALVQQIGIKPGDLLKRNAAKTKRKNVKEWKKAAVEKADMFVDRVYPRS